MSGRLAVVSRAMTEGLRVGQDGWTVTETSESRSKKVSATVVAPKRCMVHPCPWVVRHMCVTCMSPVLAVTVTVSVTVTVYCLTWLALVWLTPVSIPRAVAQSRRVASNVR
jgi:hypothetical protein